MKDKLKKMDKMYNSKIKNVENVDSVIGRIDKIDVDVGNSCVMIGLNCPHCQNYQVVVLRTFIGADRESCLTCKERFLYSWEVIAPDLEFDIIKLPSKKEKEVKKDEQCKKG